MSANGNYSVLPSLQYADSRTIRLKLCCQPSVDSMSETIFAGTCRFWGGVNRCVSGVYRDTMIGGSYTGCDSIRILNLRVVTCNLDVNLARLGNTLYANATSSAPITHYQWSTGAATQCVTLRHSGTYSHSFDN
jgi:hypothetical protein